MSDASHRPRGREASSGAISGASSNARSGDTASLAMLLRLAWRESRTARRRLLLYMSSIALGVAALVAIDSFAGNVAASVRENSQALVGGDVALSTRTGPFAKPVVAWLDSLRRAGTPVARTTTFASMAQLPQTGRTRLAQVRAVEPGYPFYGDITTRPAGRWARLHEGAHALVDRSLLVALDAQVGDTLVLGFGRFRIDGTLENVPGDPGIAAIIGPRIFIPARYLAETQLLVFGSRAEYEAVLKLPTSVAPARFLQPVRQRLEKQNVRARTVADAEQGLTRAVERLSDFLSIVGLIALLLGGVGVASGVSAFVARKIDTVAVLRCLGATSRQVLVIYLTQAAAMGLVGAVAGTLLGIGLQLLIPRALGDFLPVDVQVTLVPSALLMGVLVGVWVALVFALRPLLGLRRVSPLQAIRREVDPDALRGRGIDWATVLVNVAVVASVAGLSVQRTGRLREGLAIAGAIFGVLLLLWASAVATSWLARRALRAGWPYVVRQGVANLYRPGSQTRAVTLALGFGAFLVSTIYLVQSNLLRELDLGDAARRANVLFFDVQDDQVAGVDSTVRASGFTVAQSTPIVTMRIAAVNGRQASAMLADTTRRGPVWPLRREYRSTYRTARGGSETVVAGQWFRGDAVAGALPEFSMEVDVARELGLALGDTVTWDVQGVKIPARVTSFREVNWARFEPNFFAVFQPAALEAAPKQWVVLAQVPTADGVSRVQRDVVARHPNVSTIDLSLVQRTVSGIVEKVAVAVRFLAVFCLAIGVPVLVSAVASTRRDRLRDAVLLKTLGATRAQIGRILLAEYAVLGALGAVTGMALSFAGAWGLSRWVFRNDFVPDWGAALAIAALMMGVTVLIGVLTGREAFRGTPMAALRES